MHSLTPPSPSALARQQPPQMFAGLAQHDVETAGAGVMAVCSGGGGSGGDLSETLADPARATPAPGPATTGTGSGGVSSTDEIEVGRRKRGRPKKEMYLVNGVNLLNPYADQTTPMTEEEDQARAKRRRQLHNVIERRRRDQINNNIVELASLLPYSIHEGAALNKNNVLRFTAEFVRQLLRKASILLSQRTHLQQVIERSNIMTPQEIGELLRVAKLEAQAAEADATGQNAHIAHLDLGEDDFGEDQPAAAAVASPTVKPASRSASAGPAPPRSPRAQVPESSSSASSPSPTNAQQQQQPQPRAQREPVKREPVALASPQPAHDFTALPLPASPQIIYDPAYRTCAYQHQSRQARYLPPPPTAPLPSQPSYSAAALTTLPSMPPPSTHSQTAHYAIAQSAEHIHSPAFATPSTYWSSGRDSVSSPTPGGLHSLPSLTPSAGPASSPQLPIPASNALAYNRPPLHHEYYRPHLHQPGHTAPPTPARRPTYSGWSPLTYDLMN